MKRNKETTAPETILEFWFQELDNRDWWRGDAAMDALIRNRFAETLRQASCAETFAWRSTHQGRLAEIIVLDQFSRNIHRGTARAFAQDPMALALSQEAVAAGALAELSATQRTFILMPYMHSESRLIHQKAEALFKTFTPKSNYDFELRHKAIIDRFGRYPHRNEILGRESTADEIEFLNQPGSSF